VRFEYVQVVATIAETFDNHWAEQPGPLDTPCHIWQRATNGVGYGKLRVKGKLIGAHRFSYERVHGAVSPELDICHRCDTPACVNPGHLFSGTHKANMRDHYSKGRHGGLTPKQVKWLRKNYIPNDPEFSGHALARKLGAGEKAVHEVLRGASWRWC
jgi:hypothetical protein